MLSPYEIALRTRKSMTHNKQLITNKAAPPTDPAMMGMTDPVLEVLSAEFPIWINKQKSFY